MIFHVLHSSSATSLSMFQSIMALKSLSHSRMRGPFAHVHRREKHAQPFSGYTNCMLLFTRADFSRGEIFTPDVERLSAKNAARKSRPTVAYNVFQWYLSHRRVFPAVSQYDNVCPKCPSKYIVLFQ